MAGELHAGRLSRDEAGAAIGSALRGPYAFPDRAAIDHALAGLKRELDASHARYPAKAAMRGLIDDQYGIAIHDGSLESLAERLRSGEGSEAIRIETTELVRQELARAADVSKDRTAEARDVIARLQSRDLLPRERALEPSDLRSSAQIRMARSLQNDATAMERGFQLYLDEGGNPRILFDAARAFVRGAPDGGPIPPGRFYSTRATAMLDPQGRVIVTEGRHRAAAVARGYSIPTGIGGVPEMAGWVDSDFHLRYTMPRGNVFPALDAEIHYGPELELPKDIADQLNPYQTVSMRDPDGTVDRPRRRGSSS